jgi:hypothetical protein
MLCASLTRFNQKHSSSIEVNRGRGTAVPTRVTPKQEDQGASGMPTYGVARVVLDAPDSNARIRLTRANDVCPKPSLSLAWITVPLRVRFRRYLAADRGHQRRSARHSTRRFTLAALNAGFVPDCSRRPRPLTGVDHMPDCEVAERH